MSGRSGIGIAIDVGTSIVKVCAYDGAGVELAAVGSPAPVRRPQPGFCEYDTDDVWSAVRAAVARVTALVGTDVDRIAVTGQGDGCWLVDADGHSLGNAVLWNDGRAADVVARWSQQGRDALTFPVNGSATFAGSQAAILAWLHENQPDRLARADRALFCTGWMTHRLCGAAVMDRSDASLPWLDIRTGEPAEEILKALDLGWSAPLRPALKRDYSPAGVLTGSAAAELGLAPGIPVTHAPFDSVAMALGAGVTAPGEVLMILGTTLIVEGVTDRPEPAGEPAGMTLFAGEPGTWLRLFGTLSGTDSLNWASRLVGAAGATDYLALAEQSVPGARGLHVLPYFSPAGERAPFIDPRARATVHGLSMDHGREDLARAHIEGLAYALRHCVDHLPERPESIAVCGGASANAFLCGVIADCLQMSVRSLGGVELGTLGADVAARAHHAGTRLADEARTSVPATTVVEPDPSTAARYDSGYERFHVLRDQTVDAWSTITRKVQHP